MQSLPHGAAETRLAPVPAADDVRRVADTCNVWVFRRGRDGVCVDFGSGLVLDRLDELGLDRITDVLVTHFHRDCVQGLPRAAAAGIRIWVPPVEQDFFTRTREVWARTRPENDYDLLQTRFAPLEPVEIAGVAAEYRTQSYGGIDVYTLPTPGHTPGSVTYLVEAGGRTVACTGDLLAAGGEVWSLAATQWTYSGVEGQAATILSLGVLGRRAPDELLPAHGDAMNDPPQALAETGRALTELMELRRGAERPWDLAGWLDDPWHPLSPHLLRGRTTFATSYAVLSDSGAALVLDWGYDLWTGYPSGGERWTCRPLLHSIEALRRNHGVQRVDAVVTTHYHDDHVAGINLLREIEGVEVWAPENVAPILEQPTRYDLPCLWFEPVRVDRVLPFGEPIAWHEHQLIVHPLPGHTLYAAALQFELDAKRILVTGDQQTGPAEGPSILNYQYRNRFRPDDFIASAELYERLQPDLLLTGHWGVHELGPDVRAQLARDGRRVEELHRELLPFGDPEGFPARCTPYRIDARAGAPFAIAVEVRNPFDRDARAVVRLVLPDGWRCEPSERELRLETRGEACAAFDVTAAGAAGRVPVAADVTIGDTRFGAVTEALVTVT
jgi:glyoxylase-like metal-dependent hydrolase (beta-lactamase superfamily II)